MARSGFPSMTALLGLLAVAGYQNRDKLAEMVRQHGGGGNPDPRGRDPRESSAGGTSDGGLLSGGLGGLLGSLMGGSSGQSDGTRASSGGGLLGGLLGGGLGELDQQFRRNGRGDDVDSWVGTGPNREVAPQDLESALGPDVLDDLIETTGLSRDELLRRLSTELPRAVNEYTPQGRLPAQDEFDH